MGSFARMCPHGLGVWVFSFVNSSFFTFPMRVRRNFSGLQRDSVVLP